MTSGSARATNVTSEDVFKQVVSNVCIKTEFPLAYDEKKNRCASALAFAAHLKKAEKFKWPTTETGDELRVVLAELANDVMAEYSAPPKLIAVIQLIALYFSGSHKRSFLSDFHSALCYEDSAFGIFQNLCSMGKADDEILRFNDQATLPGFARMVGFSPICAETWISTTTALIDSAAFVDVKILEAKRLSAIQHWRGFKIGAQAPKSARSQEQELYSFLESASERAGLPVISPTDRVQHLIQGISLSVLLQGRQVAVKTLIQDKIAEQRLGLAAVSRSFVFKQYEELFEFNSHQKGTAMTTVNAAQMADITRKCKGCSSFALDSF